MALRSGLRFVDLLVEPAVDRFRLNEYGRWEELVEAGYGAAKEALPAFLASRSAGGARCP